MNGKTDAKANKKHIRKKIISLLFLIVLVFSAIGCSEPSNDPSDSIIIAAAASLELPLLEIISLYEQTYPEQTINTSFSGSRMIEEQIIRGAPVDIFISASPESSIVLQDQQLLYQSSVTTLLRNTLILAAPQESLISISSLEEIIHADIKTMGLGDPNSVPAGLYAKEALLFFNVFDDMEETLIYTQDVRQVLTLLETNNIDAGFIYLTDYLSGRQLQKLVAIPAESHSNIIYESMLINRERNEDFEENVSLFFSYLKSDQAKNIFLNHGFEVP